MWAIAGQGVGCRVQGRFYFGVWSTCMRVFVAPTSWFGVWGFGFRVSGFGFRVSGFGFRVWGLGFGVWGFRFRVPGLGFQASGSGFGVSGLAFGLHLADQVEEFSFGTRHILSRYLRLATP